MPERPPTRADMPSKLTLSITLPAGSQKPVNALILLHGLGDTSASFTQFGRVMSLPETACFVVQAPSPLPLGTGGYHWADDVQINPTTSSIEADAGFQKAVHLIVDQIIRESLMQKSGFKPREIMLFGFGQGGMAALAVAAALEEELGGVVSIGGRLPSDAKRPAESKSKTPVLLLGGSSESNITLPAIDRLKNNFESVQTVRWNKPDDSMPSNRTEMLPIMQFFARRLLSQAGVPSGSVEVRQ